MGAGYKEEAGELVSIAFHHPGPLTLEQVPPILPLAPCICCIINIITLSRLFFGFCCCMFMFACSNTTSKYKKVNAELRSGRREGHKLWELHE